jgi:hypothetical protein
LELASRNEKLENEKLESEKLENEKQENGRPMGTAAFLSEPSVD